MNKNKLIEKINTLGPWVHGYFKILDDIVISDKDLLQQKRLFHYKDYFIDIIKNNYNSEHLNEKTICEIGCNSGYFLFELYKKFNFKIATGLEPRKSNLDKAKFIAKCFDLPKNRYKLEAFDLLTDKKSIKTYDIVLVPAVLHHIGNYFKAVQNLYKMTNEICIINTLILPDEINSQEIKTKIELKDDVYKLNDFEKKFGLVGYKIETNFLDGSAFHNGLVGVPTPSFLKLLLLEAGFSEVFIYKDYKDLKQEVYNENLHRDIYDLILVCKKNTKIKNNVDYENIQRKIYKEEFDNFIPFEIINDLYKYVNNNIKYENMSHICRLIYDSQKFFESDKGKNALLELEKKLKNENFYYLIKTFKYAIYDKICFEYAKTCYHIKLLDESEAALNKIIKIFPLDWRIVYKSYYLLALINKKNEKISKALKYVNLSIKTFNNYFIALDLKKELINN
ncbi:MAG: class I SAM-dependent methyltransferase [Candidatus Sericytochromatia bacterium]